MVEDRDPAIPMNRPESSLIVVNQGGARSPQRAAACHPSRLTHPVPSPVLAKTPMNRAKSSLIQVNPRPCPATPGPSSALRPNSLRPIHVFIRVHSRSFVVENYGFRLVGFRPSDFGFQIRVPLWLKKFVKIRGIRVSPFPAKVRAGQSRSDLWKKCASSAGLPKSRIFRTSCQRQGDCLWDAIRCRATVTSRNSSVSPCVFGGNM